MPKVTGLNPVIAKTNAVVNSTIGYCQLILLWQYLHFPSKNKKESRGILSFQSKICRHRGHMLRPCQIFGALGSFRRQIRALAKLPKINPKMANKSICIVSRLPKIPSFWAGFLTLSELLYFYSSRQVAPASSLPALLSVVALHILAPSAVPVTVEISKPAQSPYFEPSTET